MRVYVRVGPHRSNSLTYRNNPNDLGSLEYHTYWRLKWVMSRDTMLSNDWPRTDTHFRDLWLWPNPNSFKPSIENSNCRWPWLFQSNPGGNPNKHVLLLAPKVHQVTIHKHHSFPCRSASRLVPSVPTKPLSNFCLEEEEWDRKVQKRAGAAPAKAEVHRPRQLQKAQVKQEEVEFHHNMDVA